MTDRFHEALVRIDGARQAVRHVLDGRVPLAELHHHLEGAEHLLVEAEWWLADEAA